MKNYGWSLLFLRHTPSCGRYQHPRSRWRLARVLRALWRQGNPQQPRHGWGEDPSRGFCPHARISKRGTHKSLTVNDLRGQGPPRRASAWWPTPYETIKKVLSLSDCLLTTYTICRKKVFDSLFICLLLRFDSIILLVMEINAKQRMERWKKLEDPKPNWEAFKRMGMFGLARWRRNFKRNLDNKNK